MSKHSALKRGLHAQLQRWDRHGAIALFSAFACAHAVNMRVLRRACS